MACRVFHRLCPPTDCAAGEPGLKKLARAVDASVCSVHNLLTDHLQPQLEQLAFRLGELRGLALCLPWRRVTGLQPEQARWAGRAGATRHTVLCCVPWHFRLHQKAGQRQALASSTFSTAR